MTTDGEAANAGEQDERAGKWRPISDLASVTEAWAQEEAHTFRLRPTREAGFSQVEVRHSPLRGHATLVVSDSRLRLGGVGISLTEAEVETLRDHLGAILAYWQGERAGEEALGG